MEPDATPHVDDWTAILGGPMGLRLRLRAPEGFTGPVVLFSLDQGAAPIYGTASTPREGEVVLSFPSIKGQFRGRLLADRLEGQWSQGRAQPLVFLQGEAGLLPAKAAPLTLERLEALRAGANAPALTAGAQRNGAAPVMFAVGRRSVRQLQPVTTSDRWHVGSITKAMTATLAARLVEQGAIAWTDTIEAVLGAAAPDMRAASRPLTLLHLLSHRAGLRANLPTLDLLLARADTRALPEQRRAYARTMLATGPVGPPESSFLYSNAGYVIAGAMLEQKTGRPWEDLLRSEIFEPLGMTGAGFGPPGASGQLDEPQGHAKAVFGQNRIAFRSGDRDADNPAVMGPAGTVHARLSDMLSFAGAHRDKPPLLSAASWRRLHQPPFGGDYALGWAVREGVLVHDGNNTLWHAEVMVDGANVAFAAANDGTLDSAAPAVSMAASAAIAALDGQH